MKQFRIFSAIACFAAAVYFLIFSFSSISVAEQTGLKKCVNACAGKRQVCFNINADKRACEVEFKSCVAACKSEKDSSSKNEGSKTANEGSNTVNRPM